MPITSSAKKAMRVAERRHGENNLLKIAYKKAIKDARKAVVSNDKKTIAPALISAQSTLDRAVKTKLLHRNTASRLFSRLTHLASKEAPLAKKTK